MGNDLVLGLLDFLFYLFRNFVINLWGRKFRDLVKDCAGFELAKRCGIVESINFVASALDTF